MGYAIETVDATLAAAAVTTEQQFIAGNSQSLSVRAAGPGSRVIVDALWGQFTVAGFTSMRSPRMHDNTKGILTDVPAANPTPVLNEYFEQTVYSQDLLTIATTFPVAPGAGALQHVGFNVIYDDLPGVSAQMRTWADVESNIEEYMGIQATPTTAASPGSWGAGVALNSTFDTMKANELYAILGYTVSAACTSVAVQGPDIGNLLVGGPGSINLIDTRRWFVEQSLRTGKPYIPVINSANKASTLVNVAANVATTAFTVNLLMAHLAR